MKLAEPTPTFTTLYKNIGLNQTMTLCRLYGGKKVYIPKISTGFLYCRNEQIYRNYMSGDYTITEIAKRYSLTKRRIFQVLRMQRIEREKLELISQILSSVGDMAGLRAVAASLNTATEPTASPR